MCVSELRSKISNLETEIAADCRDVAKLTELMRAYRDVGEEEKRLAVMRRIRDIPDPNVARDALRQAAERFVKEFYAISGDVVDVDYLRTSYPEVFALVEVRSEVLPRVLMDAMGCGCSHAVDVLTVFWKLGIVSGNKGLGLREVASVKPHGFVRLRAEAPVPESPVDTDAYAEALAYLHRQGCISVPRIQRALGLGYNPAACLLERLVADGHVRLDAGGLYRQV